VKVKTALKAGNVYDTLSAQAKDVYGDLAGYLQGIEQTIEGNADQITQKANQLWSCITSTF